MKNHIPMRRCIVCKNSKPKKELIRIVDRSSEIEIDYTGRANGIGAYNYEIGRASCRERV